MGALKPDNLVISDQQIPVTKGITLPAGDYTRGMPVGKNSGEYAKIDGTTVTTSMFDCVLCETISSTEEIKTSAYFSGKFRKTELVMEDGVTADSLIDKARDKGIHII